MYQDKQSYKSVYRSYNDYDRIVLFDLVLQLKLMTMNTQLGWTTLEQSKKLIEAELDSNTADMYYYKDQLCLIYGDSNYNNIFELFNSDGVSSNLTPCWSLGRLIELMPKYLKSGKEYFDLMVIPFYTSVKYYNESTKTYMENKHGITLMDAVIKMIERLLACKSTYLKDNPNKMLNFENDYFKKGETK